MAKDLSHGEWVVQQFEKYLCRTPQYRDVIIHSSIIEGVLRNESRKRTFDVANRSLLRSGKINSSEFCAFNEIREVRNSLVHDSFKNKLVQNEIDELRNELRGKVFKAYEISNFLNDKLFREYKIVRPACIKFNPLEK